MDKNMHEYLKLSKEFAINQLIERWVFEIQICKRLFLQEPDLNELINGSHDVISLSNKEYHQIYNKVKKIVEL